MLPAHIPEARIFTYDWNANYFEDAPVQTLFGHADVLLALVTENQVSKKRPIIFIVYDTIDPAEQTVLNCN